VALSFSATSGQGSAALVATPTGLPAGLTLTKTETPQSGASWAVTGTTTDAPGSYPVSFTVGDGTTTSSFGTNVVVAEERATVGFTGPTTFTAGDYADDEVSVTVSALVDQAADGQLGPIDAAEVAFTDTQTGEEVCDDAAQVLTPGTGQGLATCSFDADLSEFDSIQFRIHATVEGAYTGESAGEVIYTAALPEEPEEEAPETRITSGPSGWVLEDSARFAYSSSAPDSDFLCKLDGVKVVCKDPAVTLQGLAQRSHTFSVLAEDEYGERDETPATRDFAVPVDDTGLAVTSGKWKRKKQGGVTYRGTYSRPRRRGRRSATRSTTPASWRCWSAPGSASARSRSTSTASCWPWSRPRPQASRTPSWSSSRTSTARSPES
jgi:hypothetical protein